MRSLVGTVLAVLLLAGCGGDPQHERPSPAPAASAGSATAASPRCPNLVVLGFRGQGQPVRHFDGMGREAGQVASALVARLGGTSRIRGVRFPSRSGGATYDADVAAGVRLGTRRLKGACATSRVVLVGYSQGAEVVHRLAVAHPDDVDLAVLLGDPLRNPADDVPTLTLGTGRLDGRGNAGPGDRFPTGVQVLEVCVQADDVCNAPLTGRIGPPSAAHRTAYQGSVAARAIAARASRVARH